jgi:PTH1 family peptidyl-tRNA hydrolase
LNTIKLIIGLGNPGSAYEQTRHNAGAWFLEALGLKYAATFKPEKKMHSLMSGVEIADKPCKLAIPSTYMNHSGLPVREISQFYRILPSEILVIHDELDLPVGQIKLKTGGGPGGHNGLKDIMTQLGSSDFHRLRVGIDHPGHRDDVLNYVLGKPSQKDKTLIVEAINKGVEVIPVLFSSGMQAAMNILHS